VRILLLGHAPSIHTQRWATALAGRGHEVRLLTLAPPVPGSRIPARVLGRPLPVRALETLAARGAVRAEAKSFRPDVTVAHFLPNYGWLAHLAGLRPWMLVCWGSDLLLNAWRSPFHRYRARRVLRSAALTHVDAEVLAEAAVALGAPADRVWTRAWGIDTQAFRPDDAGSDAAPGGRLRILWTRMLEPLYDPATFLRALGLLGRRGVDFEATVAGSGPLRGEMESLAREQGVADRVRFVGWVPPEQLPSLYRGHDAYVSLSRSDSTSQSLLEAMGSGVVPVVSDIDGNREWVLHRERGLLVPPEDDVAVACALEELARGGDERRAMGLRARAEVEARARFEDTVRETEERLHALAAGAASPGAAPGTGGAR
jgi:glycosyltransferase involved in cell wall biosynthesis